MFHVSLTRMCTFAVVGSRTIDVHYSQLINVEFTVFCLIHMSVSDRGVLLKSPTIIVDSSIFSSSSMHFWEPPIVWYSLVRHIHIKDSYIFLENWPFYHYVMPIFSSNNCSCYELRTNLTEFSALGTSRLQSSCGLGSILIWSSVSSSRPIVLMGRN